MILKSDKKNMEGAYVGERIPSKYVLHYYEAIDQALNIGNSICSYEIKNNIFIAKLSRISDRRIKVERIDVTGIPFHEIFRMF